MSEPTITVYRDHADWDKYDRWFKMPIALLRELFVARYFVKGDDVLPEDIERHAKTVHAQHPGSVLVY